MGQLYIQAHNYGNGWLRGDFSDALAIPVYNTLPSPSAMSTSSRDGMLAIQSSDDSLQWYSNGAWRVPSGSGTVTSVTAGAGLSGGTITTSGTISLPATGVTAGSYTNASITVDIYGRITVASSGSGGGVSSVSNSDSTLTISPTTGSVVASLNTGHTNTWSTVQNFQGAPISATLGIAGSALGALRFYNSQNGTTMTIYAPDNVLGTPTNGSFVLPFSSGSSGQVLTNGGSGRTYWATPSGASPLTTKGDIYTYSTVDDRLPVGSNGQILLADSTRTTGLRWGVLPISSTTGTLTAARGGTGISSYTTGDILYASSSTLLSKLSATTDGYVLTLASGLPSWQAPATGGITRSINVVSTNTAAGSAANTDYVYFAAGNITITLPTAVGNTNRYTIVHKDTNTLTIATTGTETISFFPATPAVSAVVTVQGTVVELLSDGSNWWTI